MKRIFKKMTASLMSALMLCSSTYASFVSANATNEEIQPRTWYVYGDVNNDGGVDILDVISINKAIIKFKDLTGSSRLPLEYAVARPAVYFSNENYIPQAVDIDGDGYITEDDSQMIMYYVVERYDEAGRCGQPFYIN